MLVLGLTGGSGSGKGFVSSLFSSRGISSIDCDAVLRTVCTKGSPCLLEIASALGSEVLTDDGEYDRAATARIVFSDKNKLAVLNRITHRYILDACRQWLDVQRKNGASIAIIDAPVLYESGFDAECDAVVAVICDTQTRQKRIVARDGISEQMALMRIAKQKDNDFYRAHADFLIENYENTSREALLREIDSILASLLKKQEAVE